MADRRSDRARVRVWFKGAAVIAMAGALGWAAPSAAAAEDSPTCAYIPAVPGTPTVAAAGSNAPPVGDGLVPVWALLDGDTPLVGGRVSIYAGTGPNRNRVFVGHANRTNRNGSVVLQPRRVPDRFTVVVRGGRAGGKRFPGSLALRVARYASPDILAVNPVTTFAARYAKTHRGVGLARGAKKVKRYLEIPDWHSLSIDLRRSDQYFDGDILLKRLGGRHMSDLVRQNLTRLDRVGRFGSNPFVGETAARRRRLGDDEGFPGAGALANQFIKGIASGAGGEVGNIAMGLVLSAFGLGNGTQAELDQIQQTLQKIDGDLVALKAQVADLSAQLAQSEYSGLVAGLDDDLGAIDSADNCLAFIMTLDKANDAPEIKTLSDQLIGFIGANLVSMEPAFNRKMEGEVGSDGVIVAAYKTAMAPIREPKQANYGFWTSEVGDAPRQVFDYFSAYQGRLAMLVAEYQNVKQPDQVPSLLSAVSSDLQNEQQLLKARVPDDAVVDAQTGKVWYLENHMPCNNGTPPQAELQLNEDYGPDLPELLFFDCGATVPQSMRDFFSGSPQTVQDSSGGSVRLPSYLPLASAEIDGISPLPYRAADLGDLQALIANWQAAGASDPYDYLQKNGGFPDLPASTYTPRTFKTFSGPLIWAAQNDECQTVGEGRHAQTTCKLFDVHATGDPTFYALSGEIDCSCDPTPLPEAIIMWVADAPAGTFFYAL